jgi:hypothetical protein
VLWPDNTFSKSGKCRREQTPFSPAFFLAFCLFNSAVPAAFLHGFLAAIPQSQSADIFAAPHGV